MVRVLISERLFLMTGDSPSIASPRFFHHGLSRMGTVGREMTGVLPRSLGTIERDNVCRVVTCSAAPRLSDADLGQRR